MQSRLKFLELQKKAEAINTRFEKLYKRAKLREAYCWRAMQRANGIRATANAAYEIAEQKWEASKEELNRADRDR